VELQARALGAEKPAWLRAEYDDDTGRRWRELDVAALVRDPDFLSVAL
jgi:hypothetical protein